jgi:hypothetical protein
MKNFQMHIFIWFKIKNNISYTVKVSCGTENEIDIKKNEVNHNQIQS